MAIRSLHFCRATGSKGAFQTHLHHPASPNKQPGDQKKLGASSFCRKRTFFFQDLLISCILLGATQGIRVLAELGKRTLGFRGLGFRV